MNCLSRIKACLIVLALTTCAGNAFSDDDLPASVELNGTVVDSNDKPIAGAIVIIWTASEKVGYSIYCPSCYADCGKRATTDEKGTFKINKLSGKLRFQILAICDGYSPKYVNSIDPLKGSIQISLEKRKKTTDFSKVVRGRVVGPDGKPLRDAVISGKWVWYLNDQGKESGVGGGIEGLDPMVVCNENGEFEIAYNKPVTKMTLSVYSRGFAEGRFADLKSGETRHTLTLQTGATIRGRLMHNGKPVTDAEMGLVSQDRSMDHYSEDRIGTKKDGTFVFVNIPIGVKWYAYAKMGSILKLGATNAIECETKANDETIDLGDVEIKIGHQLKGIVKLTDGKPIPDGMRIQVSTDRAWDTQSAMLPADGRFEFNSLPTDDISIFAGVKGYHLSDKNPSLSWSIEGKIDRDIDGFVILLDEGKDELPGRIGGKYRGKPLVSADAIEKKAILIKKLTIGIIVFTLTATTLICLRFISNKRNRLNKAEENAMK